MFSRLSGAAAPFLLFFAAPLAAQTPAPVAPADLMRHIEILASDDYQGRKPGTEGETRTLAYIAAQLHARGLEPAGPDGSWYQPVPLVERAALGHQVLFTRNGEAVPFTDTQIMLQGRSSENKLRDAPVIFAGHGVSMPERGIDQLAGADLEGAVVLILLDAPDIPDFPGFMERVRNVTEAGAAAVVAVLSPEAPWEAISRSFGQRMTRLRTETIPPVLGAMPFEAAQRLVAASGGELAALLNEQPGSSFRAVTLPLLASFDVRGAVREYDSYNLLARIPGSGETGESVLLLGHWDHFGICRPEGAEDRICNGAVDNASGIAMMIEAAGRLAQGPPPPRDILFLATTAEEMGLLGAEHYVDRPSVPLDSIVAAVNMDTVALHPAGSPVAVIGRGLAPLDAAIDAAAAELGRTIDRDEEADPFIRRQDGWAFTKAGVPAVMVGGSFSDMAMLSGFLSGPYHGPEDEIGAGLVLEGAAEDTVLLVALTRRLADPELYSPPPRNGGEEGQ